VRPDDVDRWAAVPGCAALLERVEVDFDEVRSVPERSVPELDALADRLRGR
jgi:hypothetical protein